MLRCRNVVVRSAGRFPVDFSKSEDKELFIDVCFVVPVSVESRKFIWEEMPNSWVADKFEVKFLEA